MTEIISNKDNAKEKRKLLITYGITILIFILIYFFVPENVQECGPLTLLPALFLLVFIFYTKRILEGLILGTVMCYFMIYKGGLLTALLEEVELTIAGETFSWLLLVCGILGGVIAMLQCVGATEAFTEFVEKHVHSKRGVLLWTMLLGFLIFIDDYINVLLRGAAVSKVTDKYGVSREFLAYVLDSSAAAACILVPFSTWAIFVSGLFEEYGLAEAGEGLSVFIKTIPFSFYAMAALLVAFLAVMGVIKPLGAMKQAEFDAQAGIGLNSEISLNTGSAEDEVNFEEHEERSVAGKHGLLDFFLPIIVLVAVTVYFDNDVVAGLFVTVLFMFILYVAQGLITPEKFEDVFIEGIKDMVLVLVLMLFGLTFADGIDAVGCMDYLVEVGVRYANPNTFPALIFFIFVCTEFVMGLVWSLYVIAFPIVIPIAIAIGSNPILTVAAVISAGVCGSHACFYVDATILSAQATGITPYRHGITQLPYALIAAIIAEICYLIAGFIF